MIGIRGIKLDDITLNADKEDESVIKGAYKLMSTADKALATQTFNNGYGGAIKIPWSLDTLKLRDKFLASVKRDVETVLGLTEEEKETT